VAEAYAAAGHRDGMTIKAAVDAGDLDRLTVSSTALRVRD
jgi:hypothetical protein